MGQPNKSSHRGMSLVEGMISMGVLVIGILGALQGILFASQQNAVAGRLARSTSMAAQIRLGLESQGRAKLVAGTGVIGNSTTCVPVGSSPVAALADGLNVPVDHDTGLAIAGACIVDVDAYDLANVGTPINQLVPGYKFAQDFKGDNGPFRRVLVYLPSLGVQANRTADNFAVVVSTPDTGRRIFVRQFVALYDSGPCATPSNPTLTGNGSAVDL